MLIGSFLLWIHLLFDFHGSYGFTTSGVIKIPLILYFTQSLKFDFGEFSCGQFLEFLSELKTFLFRYLIKIAKRIKSHYHISLWLIDFYVGLKFNQALKHPTRLSAVPSWAERCNSLHWSCILNHLAPTLAPRVILGSCAAVSDYHIIGNRNYCPAKVKKHRGNQAHAL